MILLTPGPCMTSETVRQAAALPDLNHRDPEFRKLMKGLREGITVVYPTYRDYLPYFIGGSGTAGVEAMLTSCIREGRTLLVANGYYSERIADILTAYKLPHDSLLTPWEQPLNLEAVAKSLKTGQYEALVMVHHETTTGRLNPCFEIGELCRENGVNLLVDAISSFGAEHMTFRAQAIATTGNKCLHGIPGAAIVLAEPAFAAKMSDIPPRGYYLRLPLYSGGSPPLTPPIPALRALHQALLELKATGGRLARFSRYRGQSVFLRACLKVRGMTALVDLEDSASSLVCATLPAGFSYNEWFQANYDRGFEIYGCKGHLAETHFQVSVMGEVRRTPHRVAGRGRRDLGLEKPEKGCRLP